MIVLLVNIIQRRIDTWILYALTHTLNEACCNLKVISTTQTLDLNDDFDLVFALNMESLPLSKKIAIEKDIPLVYFFTESHIEQNYPVDYDIASYFILVRDCILPIESSLMPSFIKELRLNCPIYTMVKNVQKEASTVLIAIESVVKGHRTFFKMLPSINLSTKLKFTIVGLPESLAVFCNPHIEIIHEASEELFQQAMFIIASGCYASKAIAYHKPCIIIGDRGYGGILDMDNFEMQYQSFFQGRLGAELDEFVPSEFLQHDLLYLQQNAESDESKCLCEQLSHAFNKRTRENALNLRIYLEQLIEKHHAIKFDLEGQRLQLSDAFDFIPLKEEYLVLKSGSKVLYSSLEKDEMKVIEFFRQPNVVREVLFCLQNKYKKEELLELIQNLLEDKILILA